MDIINAILAGRGSFKRGDQVSRRQLKRLLAEGKSLKQAADIIGIHYSTACRIRREVGDSNRKNLDPQALLAAYLKGESLRKIAKLYRTTSATVYQRIRDFPEYQEAKGRTGKTRSSVRPPKITPKPVGAPQKVDPHEAWRLYRDEHWTTAMLAMEFGVRDAGVVSTALTKHYPNEYPALAAQRKREAQQAPDKNDRKFSREQALTLYRKGHSLKQIGQMLGRHGKPISIMGIQKALASFPDYASIAATRRGSDFRTYRRGNLPGNVRAVITPAGQFATGRLAALHYSVAPPTVVKWIVSGKKGWAYATNS